MAIFTTECHDNQETSSHTVGQMDYVHILRRLNTVTDTASVDMSDGQTVTDVHMSNRQSEICHRQDMSDSLKEEEEEEPWISRCRLPGLPASSHHIYSDKLPKLADSAQCVPQSNSHLQTLPDGCALSGPSRASTRDPCRRARWGHHDALRPPTCPARSQGSLSWRTTINTPYRKPLHGSSVRTVRGGSCAWMYLWTFLVLLQSPTTVLTLEGKLFYPPTFNAALRAPVAVSPVTNVCGRAEDETFCRSSSDAGTLTSCWQGKCTFRCPHPDDPYHELAFTRVVSGWGSCVSKQYDDLAPAPTAARVQVYRVRFRGTDTGTCHLDLPPDWMVSLFLQVVRSITLAMWVRPLQNTESSTLFVIGTADSRAVLSLGLTSQYQLFVTSHNQPITTRATWKLPVNEWTHLVLRIRNDTVSVAFNGTYISPAAYGVKFLGIKDAAKYRVGRSYSSNDPYKGDIQDLRIYVRSVSNRQVQQIYSGKLPTTRIQSDCLCPDDHPRLKPSDHTYCVANDGINMPTSEVYRLYRETYPLEFINDGKSDTAWVGKVGVEETSVTIDLDKQYEVLGVEVLFYTAFPDTLILERRENTTKAWTPWQYYAINCRDRFSLPDNGPINLDHEVNCRPMSTSGETPASNGKVTFNIFAGRPGHNGNGTSVSYALRRFMQADAIRLTMRGFPFSQLEKKKYHGVYEVMVKARCNCHGHGTACNTSGEQYVCTCAPQSYTRGRQCDECVDGTYRDTTQSDYSANVCRPCDCHVDGTMGGSRVCENTGGQCSCKKNVGRRRCDTCLPGYYGLDPSDPDGCRKCSCDLRGTVEGSNICDVISAQCPCKAHVTGARCDQCKPSFYSLSEDRSDGCQPCGCDPAGVLAGNLNCEQTTGKCECRPGVIGRRCNSCGDGFFKTNNTQGDACRPCECDPMGSEGTSCDPITGQCVCKTNAMGRVCDINKPGYYANDVNDVMSSGYSRSCQCSESGTLPESGGRCERLGGQCPCKNNTAGRKCDACRENTYGFNTSAALGCQDCNCDVRGTEGGELACDVSTGQCPCKSNVQSRRCDVCKNGMFGLKESEKGGCVPCDCYEPGTTPGKTCDPITGRCACVEEAGDPSITNFKCEPYVTAMVPTFGPEAGGTRLELHGGFLGNAANTKMQVGSLECPVSVSEGNQTTIVCVTSALSSSTDDLEKKGRELPVILMVGGMETASPDRFRYLDDPIIQTISPTTTFLQGGLILTVTGEHLNSVYRPLMEVNMEGPSTTKVFTSVCEVIAPAIMHCPTPNISIPDSMMSAVSRRRRDLSDVISGSDVRHGGHLGRRRVKRQEEESDDPINRPSLSFFLGFILDGVTIYRDLRDTIPEFAVLKVYLNPEIERFPYENNVRLYRPYWPYNHNFLSIKGNRLNYAASAANYKVEIGRGLCEDIDLANNLLTCRPPATQPEPHPDHGSGPSFPAVVVTVGNIRVNVGWMDYEHNFWENLPFRYGVVGGLLALLLIIILLCLCCCCRRCRRQPEEKPHPHLELSSKGSTNNAYISAYNGSQTSYMSPTMELLSLLPDRLKGRVEASLIDYKRMEVGKLIGQGHFGRIYLGRLASEDHSTQMPIAIKTLREYHVTPRDVAYFLDEATIMKDLKHEHVLHLLGVVIENNRSYVLLPYMENGDLKSFISNEDNLLTVGELINFGQQVADGMCYLSDQKFVHRDLAARNCMVDRYLVVKIADFGLSRELYESDYYREGEASRPLPVKWMSYESLERGIFTTQSDVWSFGVLLWELMTRGCTPYPDVDCFDMKVYITCGNRMDKPDFAPHDLYELMMLCWQREPQSRPTFYEIHTRLDEILEGQNVTNTMRHYHERHVRPLSFGGVQNHGFTNDITREMEY